MADRKWLTTKWFRFILVPTVAALPPLIAAVYFKANQNSHAEPYVFAGVGIWEIIVSIGKSYLNDFAKTTIEGLERAREELAHLFNYVRIVVGAKSRRFFEAFDHLPDTPNPGATFFEITRPDLQIKELVEAVQGYFQILAKSSDDRIKVSLMCWNGSHLEYREWFPDADTPRRADASTFADARTLAGLAYHTKLLVISEDIEHDARYRHLGAQRDSGSMFSYPVIDEQIGEVIFVVNAVSSTVGRFRQVKNDADRIRYAMDIFAERMILENRLDRIKERIENKSGGTVDHG